MLIGKDFYSYVRTFSEYYAPFNNKAKIYMRQFYNENGSIAYREYIDEDEHVLCLMMHVYTVNKHSSHTLYVNCY